MKTMRWFMALSLAAALGSATAVADNDIDLPINGDFRGMASGYSPAPGWTLTPDGGSARVLPTSDRDDFILELQAAANRAQSAVSELHLLPGNVLKLEVKVSGAGMASVGYETFDDARRAVASDRLTVPLAAYDQKVKRYFTLTAPAKYIRIRLTAEAGATARFRDADADISGLGVMPAAPAGTVAAPAPAGTVAAPAPAGTVAAPPAVAAPAPVAAPATAPAQPAAAPAAMPPAGTRMLQNDKYYMYSFLGQDEHFEVSLPVGSDIDFELGEDISGGLVWRLQNGYNAGVCRVKMEHDQDGVFPVRWDKAEIELKALQRGTTNVVFVCGTKRVTVHFTAL